MSLDIGHRLVRFGSLKSGQRFISADDLAAEKDAIPVFVKMYQIVKTLEYKEFWSESVNALTLSGHACFFHDDELVLPVVV